MGCREHVFCAREEEFTAKGQSYLVGMVLLDPTLLEASDEFDVCNSSHMHSKDLFLEITHTFAIPLDNSHIYVIILTIKKFIFESNLIC